MINTSLTRSYVRLLRIEDDKFLQYFILSGITLIAAMLRFYKLGEWSFWIDEIFTIKASQGPAAYDLYWPRISLLLTALNFKWMGINEWSARLVPAVIGILSVPVLFFPIRKMAGSAVALVAVALLAVSPWHLYWSQNARFYTSLLLLYTLALLYFHFALEEDRPFFLIVSFFFIALAAIERFIALFIVPVLACYLLVLLIIPWKLPPGLRLKNLALFALPFAAFGFFEVYILIRHGSQFTFVLSDLEWFMRFRIDDPFRLLSFISYDIGIPLMCVAISGGTFLILRRNRVGILLLVSAVLPVLLLLGLNPFVFTKDRYIFTVLTSWVILSACAVRELFSQIGGSGKVLATGVLLSLLAAAAGENLLYYKVNNGNRRDWKGAFALVKEMSQSDDEFVAWWPEFGPFYLNRRITSWADIAPETVRSSGKTFWFILDSETVWGNLEMKYWVEQHAYLVDVRYLRLPDDFSLRIYCFNPRKKVREIRAE